MTVAEIAARYAQAVDRRDEAAVAALFTEDAVFVLDPMMRMPEQPEQWEGATAIAQGVIAGLTGLIATRHEIGGQTTETDGDTVTAYTYCQAHHIFERKGEPTDEVMAVRYLDTLVKVDGQWRISRRELHLDFTWRQAVRLPAR